MIEARGLTKHYGAKKAVDNVSFTIQPGQITGFLGPNGAGKSTSMRLMVGLDRPDSGSVTINGQNYASFAAPLAEVGVLLDAKGVHPGRSAKSHLRALAATHGIPERRVNEVIEMAGLEAVAGKRVGGFSLGMGQRLGIAAALLGDPRVLILDEPVNGLDPDGVLWVRNLLKHLAGEGRTVLLSSHLMSEMAQIADHVIVLGRGRVVADAPMQVLLSGGAARVTVRSPRAAELASLVLDGSAGVAGIEIEPLAGPNGDGFTALGLSSERIGEVAAANGIVLHELTTVGTSLEEAYMSLTRGELEYTTN